MSFVQLIVEYLRRNQGELPEVTVAAFNRYLQYVDAFWLNSVGVQRFSVYNEPRRTNNDMESFHRRLNRAFGGLAHGGFFPFVSKWGRLITINSFLLQLTLFNSHVTFSFSAIIQQQSAAMLNDFNAAQAGMSTTAPRRRVNIQRDARLRALNLDLVQQRISIFDFLTVASNLFDPLHGAEPNQVKKRMQKVPSIIFTIQILVLKLNRSLLCKKSLCRTPLTPS